jgi:hypothetical protein
MIERDAGAMALGEALGEALAALDVERIRWEYREQNEFVFLERFLPPAVVAGRLVPHVEALKPLVHRSYIPRFKKSGSVSSYTLAESAPAYLTLYRAPALIEFLSRLTERRLVPCPDDDPHACALYYYTEPGDHIGFHYDTSYYEGARYTVLVGLVQRSENCRLVCQLHRDDPARTIREIQLTTTPGSMVIFNGDKLWHAVTPLGEGEERVSLTMEYVTNPRMRPVKRLFSNMKDAFAYFGVRALLHGRKARAGS